MAFALPFLFTVFVWWFSTGVILYLDGLPRPTFKWTFAGATVVCGLGFIGLAASAQETTVWAWQEVAFLLGYVTGPRRIACDPEARGWQRVWRALQTVLHHELALLLLGAAVFGLSWNQPNQTGWWTFAVLWAMRQSAKLNVFLGVRNLGENFLPSHLQYLKSYFTRKPMNPLLPVSVIVAAVIVVPIWQAASAAGASGFEVASFALVGSLLSLAILEHLLLVLPLPSEALWKFVLRTRDEASPPATTARSPNLEAREHAAL